MPIPTVLWGQRKDKLYVTLDIQDVKDEKLKLDNVDGNGKLTFSGKAGKEQQEYTLDLNFQQEIDVEASKVSVSPRSIFMVIAKKELGHWPRLTKEPGKQMSHVKCDWNKWVDEDEEDEKPEFDMSGMNFSGFGEGGMGGMGGMMGGMGGMGGMDMSALMGGMGGMGGMGMGGEEGEEEEEDSDNEELPDLVK